MCAASSSTALVRYSPREDISKREKERAEEVLSNPVIVEKIRSFLDPSEFAHNFPFVSSKLYDATLVVNTQISRGIVCKHIAFLRDQLFLEPVVEEDSQGASSSHAKTPLEELDQLRKELQERPLSAEGSLLDLSIWREEIESRLYSICDALDDTTLKALIESDEEGSHALLPYLNYAPENPVEMGRYHILARCMERVDNTDRYASGSLKMMLGNYLLYRSLKELQFAEKSTETRVEMKCLVYSLSLPLLKKLKKELEENEVILAKDIYDVLVEQIARIYLKRGEIEEAVQLVDSDKLTKQGKNKVEIIVTEKLLKKYDLQEVIALLSERSAIGRFYEIFQSISQQGITDELLESYIVFVKEIRKNHEMIYDFQETVLSHIFRNAPIEAKIKLIFGLNVIDQTGNLARIYESWENEIVTIAEALNIKLDSDMTLDDLVLSCPEIQKIIGKENLERFFPEYDSSEDLSKGSNLLGSLLLSYLSNIARKR